MIPPANSLFSIFPRRRFSPGTVNHVWPQNGILFIKVPLKLLILWFSFPVKQCSESIISNTMPPQEFDWLVPVHLLDHTATKSALPNVETPHRENRPRKTRHVWMGNSHQLFWSFFCLSHPLQTEESNILMLVHNTRNRSFRAAKNSVETTNTVENSTVGYS